eukprot:COSAG02_NODE_7274_length_3088_cov_2.456340_3_plen_174_part_00
MYTCIAMTARKIAWDSRWSARSARFHRDVSIPPRRKFLLTGGVLSVVCGVVQKSRQQATKHADSDTHEPDQDYSDSRTPHPHLRNLPAISYLLVKDVVFSLFAFIFLQHSKEPSEFNFPELHSNARIQIEIVNECSSINQYGFPTEKFKSDRFSILKHQAPRNFSFQFLYSLY